MLFVFAGYQGDAEDAEDEADGEDEEDTLGKRKGNTHLTITILYNWYFLQASKFCYFRAPNDSTKITSFK